MKNLKSDFFMNIIHMQKWRVTIVYVKIPRLDQDKKPCSVTTVYDGSIVYEYISVGRLIRLCGRLVYKPDQWSVSKNFIINVLG